jgi:hypothetical protein
MRRGGRYRCTMPSALRAQVALIGFLAALLIPIATSSLRGLTHILTCQEEATTPFLVEMPDEGPPLVSSSMVLEREESGLPASAELCGGLTLDLAVGGATEGRADVIVTIANNSTYGWRGTVQLRLDDTMIPVDIGTIDAGGSESDTVELRVRPGRSYEIEGSLLVGP